MQRQRASRTILLVDTSDEHLEVYGAAFRKHGFHVIEARTESDAARIAAAVMPVVIVTEIPLLAGDGISLTRALKQDERTRHIPLVVLTAEISGDERREAGLAGCDWFVIKPCLPHELVGLVKALAAPSARRRGGYDPSSV